MQRIRPQQNIESSAAAFMDEFPEKTERLIGFSTSENQEAIPHTARNLLCEQHRRRCLHCLIHNSVQVLDSQVHSQLKI